MKKIAYLLLALPMMFVSCSDDDNNLPKFNVQVDFAEGVTVDDGVITVVQGQPLSIESVKPVDYDAKEIAFGTVTYQLDYTAGISTNVAPFAMTFSTDNIPVGRHLFRIMFPVFAVDYSVCQAVVNYTLIVTEPSDTPDNPDVNPQGGSQIVTPKLAVN